jgi:hypothetical protein
MRRDLHGIKYKPVNNSNTENIIITFLRGNSKEIIFAGSIRQKLLPHRL